MTEMDEDEDKSNGTRIIKIKPRVNSFLWTIDALQIVLLLLPIG